MACPHEPPSTLSDGGMRRRLRPCWERWALPGDLRLAGDELRALTLGRRPSIPSSPKDIAMVYLK